MSNAKRITALLKDGPMKNREIAKCMGLTERQTVATLRHMHSRGDVERIDHGPNKASQWAIAGQGAVKANLAEQRKTLIGRYLTGAPL
ncbi:hypothetical protein [Alcanivorax sp.]|uniref:hypothetical protein n=1 Tax=Alcanivorax sp. TaxID=1872427 RepID=UPI003A947584